MYTCTEDIEENGRILAYQINNDGSLTLTGSVDAGGTSTCYLTVDRDQRHLIAVNYWDSSLAVIPLKEDGSFAGKIKNMYDPRGGIAMRAQAKKFGGVNHSNNDESTIAQRQVDPHSHALVSCICPKKYLREIESCLSHTLFHYFPLSLVLSNRSSIPLKDVSHTSRILARTSFENSGMTKKLGMWHVN